MAARDAHTLVSLPVDAPVWASTFLVAPLVIVGTKDGAGNVDLAPKHMAMPLGWQNRFCFVCTPRHTTYANVVQQGCFTVSFLRPEQVLQASLAAIRRSPDDAKPSLDAIPVLAAAEIDGVLVEGAGFFLECRLERVVNGFDDASLVVGRVVAAHADPALLRGDEREDGDLLREAPLLAYLSPGRFASVSESLAFPYPADFAL